MVDEMWYQAGDKSIDLNWYTKRGILSGIYTATELYMLTDKSTDFKSTWEFLDRRVEDVIQITTIGIEAQKVAVTVGNGFYSLLSGAFSQLVHTMTGKTVFQQDIANEPKFKDIPNEPKFKDIPTEKISIPIDTLNNNIPQKPFGPSPILHNNIV